MRHSKKNPDDARLEYHQINNASVVIELPDAEHADNPISHWRGQLDLTQKLFGVLNGKRFDLDSWRKTNQGLIVYDDPVRVLASERQNRMIVCERE